MFGTYDTYIVEEEYKIDIGQWKDSISVLSPIYDIPRDFPIIPNYPKYYLGYSVYLNCRLFFPLVSKVIQPLRIAEVLINR